jgi:hypothetical protein
MQGCVMDVCFHGEAASALCAAELIVRHGIPATSTKQINAAVALRRAVQSFGNL